VKNITKKSFELIRQRERKYQLYDGFHLGIAFVAYAAQRFPFASTDFPLTSDDSIATRDGESGGICWPDRIAWLG
jgi:hypothetical protein